MPQISASTPVKSVMWWRQAPASKSSSRAMPGRHCTSRPQPAGQASTQSRQAPQRLSTTGSPAGSSRSVKTVARRTAGPNSGEMNSAVLPIHPRPACVAAVLCGNGLSPLVLLHGRLHALRGVAVDLEHVDQRVRGVVERDVHAQVLLLVVLRGTVPQAAHDQRIQPHEDGDGRGVVRRLRQPRDRWRRRPRRRPPWCGGSVRWRAGRERAACDLSDGGPGVANADGRPPPASSSHRPVDGDNGRGRAFSLPRLSLLDTAVTGAGGARIRVPFHKHSLFLPESGNHQRHRPRPRRR